MTTNNRPQTKRLSSNNNTTTLRNLLVDTAISVFCEKYHILPRQCYEGMELHRLVIVGAGASSSTPKMGCVTGATCVVGEDGKAVVDYSTIRCPACRDAVINPNTSKNHRLNPSLLIQLRGVGIPPVEGELFNILIDCGKTFRESAIKVFPQFGVRNLNALLLTHNHADACFGVDDLREYSSQGDRSRACGHTSHQPLFVFADPCTMDSMRSVFGYLFPKKTPHSAKGAWVAKLDWVPFQQGTVIDIPTESDEHGDVLSCFPILSFPVEHGPGCQCNAFLVQLPASGDANVIPFFLYMSDVSKFTFEEDGARLQKSMEKLYYHRRERSAETDSSDGIPRFVVDLLVLDLLGMEPYFAHFSRDEAVEVALKIGARQTHFVGMSHTMDYDRLQRHVTKESSSPMGPSTGGLGSCYVDGVAPELLVGFDGSKIYEAA